MSDDDAMSLEAGELPGESRESVERSRLAEEVARQLMSGGFADQMLRAFERRASLVLGDLALAPQPKPQAAASEASGSTTGTEMKFSSKKAWDLVEPFDPDAKEASISRWVSRLDMLAEMHGWSGKQKVLASQARLDGAAKRWFHRLDHINFEWPEWCDRLKAAFPMRTNFGELIEELANRRKRSGETMTEYYRDKLALCVRAGISGENAVSCIIHGLPETYRANAYAAKCASPEALYNDLLAGLESCREGTPAAKAPGPRTLSQRLGTATRPTKREHSPPTAPAGPRLVRCFNCQEMTTHMSRDCPLERKERCRQCGEANHVWVNCPRRKEATRTGPRVDGASKKVSFLLKATDTFAKKALVNGCPVKAYIDSGSERSILTLAAARRLGLGKRREGTGVVLSGFGGGQVVALGEAWFTAEVDGIDLEVKALVADVDVGDIELLLGQSSLDVPGVTMVVRDGKALLSDEGDITAFLGRLTLAERGSDKFEVRLAAGMICPP
ncbi:uncharacterized protein LOC116160702 [Photinus pyralis]|uniref:uncharacterized protein LOC116160702 n=1 Tax=Photinus pyralis TaxID=7054 RepID=UPI0012675ED1|nr:uncharacterized protein LOC116160702 [Photinus pyralis]